MKKYILSLLCALSFIPIIPCSAEYDWCRFDLDTDATFGMGWRKDEIKWEVIAPGPPLTSLREKWRDLNIFQLTGRGEAYVNDRYYIRLDGDYGWIEGGNKTFDQTNISVNPPLSEGQLRANSQGHVWDFSAGFGYLFCLCENLSITPLIGYSYSEQKVKDNRYRLVGSPVDAFSDVNSYYKYQWQGAWFGINLDYQWCNWSLFAEYQYHPSRYKAILKENIAISFTEIQKIHDPHGNEVYAGLYYHFECPLTFGVMANYKDYQGHNGTATAVEVPVPLSQAKWTSVSVTFEASYCF